MYTDISEEYAFCILAFCTNVNVFYITENWPFGELPPGVRYSETPSLFTSWQAERDIFGNNDADTHVYLLIQPY